MPARRPCSRCGRNRAERFFSGPRGRICTTCKKKARSNRRHDRRVSETYGLEPGEYKALFEAQGGVCAICGGSRRTRLDVDHDHKTGLVRGLLCRQCNRKLLTAARDNPATLKSAAYYLENPPAPEHIGERFFSEQVHPGHGPECIPCKLRRGEIGQNGSSERVLREDAV